jgi:beta-alanine--pyruvate transaminase
VIVEPVAGSTGVLIPPKGYLKRLREICDQARHPADLRRGHHRVRPAGRRRSRRSYFGVTPDMITTAKGITNGHGADGRPSPAPISTTPSWIPPENMIELFHGYTYSAIRWPVPPRSRRSTPMRRRASDPRRRSGPYWEDGLHSLKDCPHVIDIRNLGLIGAIELEPSPGADQTRLLGLPEAYDDGLLIRTTGDIIALSPPLIISKAQIDELFDTLRDLTTPCGARQDPRRCARRSDPRHRGVEFACRMRRI